MLLITDIQGKTAGLWKPMASKQCLSRYVGFPSRRSKWLSGPRPLHGTWGVPKHRLDIALLPPLHVEQIR